MSVVWKRNSKVHTGRDGGREHKNKSSCKTFFKLWRLWRFFPIARRKGSFLLYAIFEKYPFCANSWSNGETNSLYNFDANIVKEFPLHSGQSWHEKKCTSKGNTNRFDGRAIYNWQRLNEKASRKEVEHQGSTKENLSNLINVSFDPLKFIRSDPPSHRK